jgi:hypothetical protein
MHQPKTIFSFDIVRLLSNMDLQTLSVDRTYGALCSIAVYQKFPPLPMALFCRLSEQRSPQNPPQKRRENRRDLRVKKGDFL